MELTEKHKELLLLFYYEGYPHPTDKGYFFSDNVRCDMRICKALFKKGLVGYSDKNNYFGAGRGIGSRIILTEAGEKLAEEIIEAELQRKRRW